MEPFIRVESVAVPVFERNVDTDQLVPARFLARPRGELGDIVFQDRCFAKDGSRTDFVLNRPEYEGAKIILGARNFGCGSSREAAVWALQSRGFRTAIAPSFGDIFFTNCFKNGMLPVVLPEERVAKLCEELEAQPGAEMTVDLEQQVVIGPNGSRDAFTVDPFRREMLLSGQDELAMTLGHLDRIKAYEAKTPA